MSYWALNAVFLAVAGVVAVVAVVRVVAVARAVRAGRGSGHPDARGSSAGLTAGRAPSRVPSPAPGLAPGRTLGAFGIAFALLLALTAVFDNVMIGIGLVGYDPALISGAFIGIAPLEDFAYAIAAAVLLPSLWLLLERRPRS